MFWQVILLVKDNITKYESCKHTKTKTCRNILCWFICGFIWWMRTCPIFKKYDQTKYDQIVSNYSVYIIKFMWFNQDSTNLIK